MFSRLWTLGLGAALMYMFDPQFGKRRRALVRDKVVRARRKTAEAIDTTSRDLQNRAHGFLAETRGLISREPPGDEVLADRIRSQLGFLVSHPSAVDVEVRNGRVILSGPVLRNEISRLLKRITSIRGIKDIENRLEPHEDADGVPGLQGARSEARGQVPDLLQSRWAPATRFIAGTTGAFMLAAGRGIASKFLGLGLLARALTNMEFGRLLGIGGGADAVSVHRIINADAPVEEVFSFWTNYENFPRFMRNIRDVRETGEKRSHWVAAGPAGVPVEWDAEVTRWIPNREIAWKTVPESPIQHQGRVLFQPNPDGTTRVDIRMSYNPVAGALGHAVATLFGADPKSEMDEDLARVKMLIESGIPPRAGRTNGAPA